MFKNVIRAADFRTFDVYGGAYAVEVLNAVVPMGERTVVGKFFHADIPVGPWTLNRCRAYGGRYFMRVPVGNRIRMTLGGRMNYQRWQMLTAHYREEG